MNSLVVARSASRGGTALARCATLASSSQKLPQQHNNPLRIKSSTTSIRVLSQAAASPSESPSATTTTSSESTATASVSNFYMWGTDTKGSLLRPSELRDTTKLDIPTPIDFGEIVAESNAQDSSAAKDDANNSKISSVYCGATDTAVLLEDGSCYVWGENKNGQCGVGHAQPVSTPTRVELPTDNGDEKIIQVSLGKQMGAFVTALGDLYTCGFGGSVLSGGFGLLGHGSAADNEVVHSPKLVTSIVEDGCYVKQVQVGESHMTCLTTEGEVLTTGSGSYGRLGNFDTIDQLYFEPVEILTQGVEAIAGGKSFTLALMDGVLYGWGRNHKGQLGTGLGLAVDMYAMQPIPEPIEADELVGRRVVKVAAGSGHAACITQGGELFYWGMSLHLEPFRVTQLLHTKVVDVVCGLDYTLAVDEEGRMYSFGKGNTGVLGQGSVKTLNQPQVMEVFNGKKVKLVSAGWKHAACLVED